MYTISFAQSCSLRTYTAVDAYLLCVVLITSIAPTNKTFRVRRVLLSLLSIASGNWWPLPARNKVCLGRVSSVSQVNVLCSVGKHITRELLRTRPHLQCGMCSSRKWRLLTSSSLILTLLVDFLSPTYFDCSYERRDGNEVPLIAQVSKLLVQFQASDVVEGILLKLHR